VPSNDTLLTFDF